VRHLIRVLALLDGHVVRHALHAAEVGATERTLGRIDGDARVGQPIELDPRPCDWDARH
jgi:hypothetical protein